MRNGWVFIVLTLPVWLVFSPRTGQALDEVVYKSMVDKNKIKISEQVQFLILINYALNTMPPNVIPPSFDRFTVVNEYQTTQEAGDDTEKFLVYKKLWLLSPNETGHLSIASAIITYQDPTSNLLRTGKTAIQFVDVLGSDEAAAAPVQAKKTGMASVWLWVVGGLSAFLGVVGLTLLWLSRRPTAKAPAVSAEQTALNGLQQGLEFVEQENLEAYYSILTRTLLDYLQNKFGLDAHVLATPALLEKMATLGYRQDVLAALETFFKVTDRIKFASYQPAEDELIQLHEAVKRCVETGARFKAHPPKRPKTKPKDEEEE